MIRIVITNHSFNFKLKTIVIDYDVNYLKKIKIVITNYNFCNLDPMQVKNTNLDIILKHILL